MMLMKQYLSTMSKRIDELVAKTQALEAEVRKSSDSARSEVSGLSEMVEKLASNQEDTHTLIQNARDEMKKRSEEIEANLEGFATYESISEIQNKLDKQIETLREEKLDREDFKEFEDSTFNPLKELFQDSEQSSSSFAEFARAQASASPVDTEEEEELPPPETEAPEESAVELQPPNIPPPPPEQKRTDKKKKKWL